MWGSVHQEVEFPTTPSEVYDALMNSARHAEFTGRPANISPEEGGSFTCHGGEIEGRNVELHKGSRIVQAWRVAGWEKGVYSVVRFEITKSGKGAKVVLDHTGIPEGGEGPIEKGWSEMYWNPMAKLFGGVR